MACFRISVFMFIGIVTGFGWMAGGLIYAFAWIGQ